MEVVEVAAANKKRRAPDTTDDDSQTLKRAKTKANGADNGAITIADTDGAIVIDDDDD